MTTVSLAQAERIIDAAIERGAALNSRPLSVIVVEPGCKVKAFKKEDGSSMIRFEMAHGKAYAALSLGRSSKLVREVAQLGGPLKGLVPTVVEERLRAKIA